MSEPSSTITSGKDLPTGTVTFLFTDIEGSTKLLQALGENDYKKVLEEHAQLVREAIARGEGVEVSTEGDAFFVVFRSAQSAMASAAAAQELLADHTWPPGVEVRVRMGLHTGEGVIGGDNYIGLDVHRAARIASAGHGQQILISSATKLLVEGTLPSDVGLKDLGDHRLKDLEKSEHLYQVTIDGMRAEFPPLKTLDGRPNNLPVQLTSFVGREHDIEEVASLLRANRLVTLTGPGGGGKTRLSIKVGELMLEEMPDGVFFVPLAPISDPELVTGVVALTLGLKEEPARSITETINSYLESKELLIIMDNFEQITRAAPVVSDLLAASPKLKILITSREVLRLNGEQEYPVRPLSLPDYHHLPPLAQLSQFEAVALFIQRATSVSPSFAVTNENAPAVAEICARLDGLPLAIELAAARIKLLSPQTILQRLQKSLSLLTGGARDLPARQQTLRNAIEWSYNLLDVGEKQLFRRLAVFVGGWTIEGADAVCNPEGEVGLETLDGLGSLSDKSLLKQVLTDIGETRFMMLETIREFGLDMFALDQESEFIRQRHAETIAAFTEAAQPNLTGKEQALWLDRVDHDHDNIRSALQWCIESDRADIGLPIISAIWRYWQIRGLVSEGAQWAGDVLKVPSAQERNAVRAHGVNALGSLEYWRNDFVTTRKHYEEALAIFRDIRDEIGEAEALYNLGFVLAIEGHHGEGIEYYGRAREIYAKHNNELMVAWTKLSSGMVAGMFEEDPSPHIPKVEEGIETMRNLGDRFGVMNGLTILGRLYIDVGNEERGKQVLWDATEMFLENNELWGIASHMDDFAKILGSNGNYEMALKLGGAAQAIRDRLQMAAPAALVKYVDPRETSKGHLTEAEIDEFWQQGYGWSLEEAIDYMKNRV